MSAPIALALWIVVLFALFIFDPAKAPKTSVAVWVPVVWMFIVGSRLPSQWFGGGDAQGVLALEEGNPLDRTIFFALILLAIGILASRSFNWGAFVGRNSALIAFLAFAFVSVVWADLPFVAAKRWVRDLGNYLVVLVALSDRQPVEAVRAVLRRLCFVLIPLSILLIKYFPSGRAYNYWTGIPEYVGATTSKNMLGATCLVSGLFFFWDTVTRWRERREPRVRRIILLNLAFMGMTGWLLNMSSSATSRVCLILGCLVVVAAHGKMFRRYPRLFQLMIPAAFVLYIVLAFGLGLNGQFAGAVGRDPTLTDRTKIWSMVLSVPLNPLLGTGYESFWVGPRLLKLWQSGLGGLNESHNGYLETYLNLGLIGLFLLVGFLVGAYRIIWKQLKPVTPLGSLGLALWTLLLFYNVTEAAFKGQLIWVVFLLGAIYAPSRTGRSTADRPVEGGAGSKFAVVLNEPSATVGLGRNP